MKKHGNQRNEGRSVGQTPIKVGVFNLEIEGLAAPAMSPKDGEQKNCFSNMVIKQKFNFRRKDPFKGKRQSGDAATMVDEDTYAELDPL